MSCFCFLSDCETCQSKLLRAALDQQGHLEVATRAQCFCFQPSCETCHGQKKSSQKKPTKRCLSVGAKVAGARRKLQKFAHSEATQTTVPASQARCCCFQPDCFFCSGTAETTFVASPAGEVRTDSKGRMKRAVRVDVAEINKDGRSAIAKAYPEYVAQLLSLMKPSWSAMEEIGRPRGETWQFWEIYSGCGRLTKALIAAGCTCGPPVDVNGSGCSLDLRLAQNRSLIWQLLVESKVRWVHFGFPCTFWVNLSRCTAKRTLKMWSELQEEALQHTNLSMHGLRYQESHDRSGSLEQPKGSGALRLNGWSDLEKVGFRLYTYHSCAFGLADEIGRPQFKPGAVGSNRDLQCMQKYCSCKKKVGVGGRRRRRHSQIQGTVQSGPCKGQRRSQVAGQYTAAWCLQMSKAILPHTL